MRDQTPGDEIRRFFERDRLAATLEVDARVVAARIRLSAGELAASRDQGHVTADPTEPMELVAGGVVVATGRIVEEDDASYFEIEEVK